LEAARSTGRHAREPAAADGTYRLGSCEVNRTRSPRRSPRRSNVSTWKLRGQPDYQCRCDRLPGERIDLEAARSTGLMRVLSPLSMRTYRLGSCEVNRTRSSSCALSFSNVSTWKLRGQPDTGTEPTIAVKERIDLEAARSTGQRAEPCGRYVRTYRLGSCEVNRTLRCSPISVVKNVSTWKLRGQPDSTSRASQRTAERIDLEAARSTGQTTPGAHSELRTYRLGSCEVNRTLPSGQRPMSRNVSTWKLRGQPDRTSRLLR